MLKRNYVKDNKERRIGIVKCEFSGKWVYGTGSLIGEDTVLTCAHIIYNDKKILEKILNLY